MPDTPVCAYPTRTQSIRFRTENRMPGVHPGFDGFAMRQMPVEWCLHESEAHVLATGITWFCKECPGGFDYRFDHPFGGPNGDQVTTNPEEYRANTE